MKSKTLLATAGAMLAVASLAGCSSASGGASADGATRVTLVPGTKGSPFYEAMACGAKAASKEHEVTLDVAAPDTWGAATQLPVLDTVAAQNPNALLVVPTDVEALTPRLQEIKDNGTPIVLLDQTVTDTSVAVSRIGSNDEEGGREAAKAMAEAIGGKGKVMAISSPPGTDAQYVRVNGFKEELKANFPDIEYIGEQLALNDVTAASGFVTSTLASTPDLAGVFVTNDINATGAVTGLEEAGATGKVKVVAYDAAESEVDSLKSGAIDALIAQDPYGEGFQGIEQALAALDDKATKKSIAIPLETLTMKDEAALEKYLSRNGGC